jgi:hypothetical protein
MDSLNKKWRKIMKMNYLAGTLLGLLSFIALTAQAQNKVKVYCTGNLCRPNHGLAEGGVIRVNGQEEQNIDQYSGSEVEYNAIFGQPLQVFLKSGRQSPETLLNTFTPTTAWKTNGCYLDVELKSESLRVSGKAGLKCTAK